MPRKKSVAPEPNEQELMEQAAEAVESAVAEGPTENAAPSDTCTEGTGISRILG